MEVTLLLEAWPPGPPLCKEEAQRLPPRFEQHQRLTAPLLAASLRSAHSSASFHLCCGAWLAWRALTPWKLTGTRAACRQLKGADQNAGGLL